MLQSMQQTATAPPSSGSASFAGLIAAFAAPAQKPAWNDDDLADDVATLSYERALRARSRYKAPEPCGPAFTQPLDPDVLRFCETIPDDAGLDAPMAAPQAAPASIANPKVAPSVSTAHDRNLRCASITIRLSKAECAQLRRRAAEAGLTVSAYLRSCTFEAESLRALVKDTLAQLRTDPTPASQPVSVAEQPGWRQWLTRLLPHTSGFQRTARA